MCLRHVEVHFLAGNDLLIRCVWLCKTFNHLIRRPPQGWAAPSPTGTVQRLPDPPYDSHNDFVRDTRRHEFGFNGYDFWDEGEILSYPE